MMGLSCVTFGMGYREVSRVLGEAALCIRVACRECTMPLGSGHSLGVLGFAPIMTGTER